MISGVHGDRAGDDQALLLAAGEARRRRRSSRSFTSSHRPALRSEASTISLQLGRASWQGHAGARHRPRCRRSIWGTGSAFWNTMPTCARSSTGSTDLSLTSCPSISISAGHAAVRDRVVHPVDGAQEGGLAAARWSDKRGDRLLGHVERDIEQRLLLAVEDRNGLSLDLGRRLGGGSRARGRQRICAERRHRVHPAHLPLRWTRQSRRPTTLNPAAPCPARASVITFWNIRPSRLYAPRHVGAICDSPAKPGCTSPAT